MRLHHAHRPAPGEIDPAVEDARNGVARRRRGNELHGHALASEKAKRLRGIERRVEDGAEVFGEADFHEGP